MMLRSKLAKISLATIAVLGLGSENEALILWLAAQGKMMDITIYDRRPLETIAEKKEKISNETGVRYAESNAECEYWLSDQSFEVIINQESGNDKFRNSPQ